MNKFTKLEQEILKVLLDSKTALNASEISTKVNKSKPKKGANPTIIRNLTILSQFGNISKRYSTYRGCSIGKGNYVYYLSDKQKTISKGE